MQVRQANLSLIKRRFQLSDAEQRRPFHSQGARCSSRSSQIAPNRASSRLQLPFLPFSWHILSCAPRGTGLISPTAVAADLETWLVIRILVCMRPPSYSDPVALSRGSRRCLIPPASALFSFLVYSSTPKSGWSMFPDEKSIILLALVLPRLI